MYEVMILIDPDDTITSDQLAAELRRFYAGTAGGPIEIALSNDTVALRWPEYELEVGRSTLPHVLEESAELAVEYAADHPAKDRIARCMCRFEMSGPPDPQMDHFNDSLFVGEALERLGRVYRFDQGSGEFTE